VTKPKTADGYTPDQLQQVQATCLYLASILGDFLDELVIVGGLVPSLLVGSSVSAEEAHVGTADLDLGLQVGLLDSHRYQALAERLRGSGFEAGTNADGRVTRQLWRHPATSATIDFLIAPASSEQKGGSLQDLEADFAAMITPGLALAFRDREFVRVEGRTLLGEALSRDIPVCGPGAFVVLKALAFRGRGENKDAYDIHYVLRHFGESVEVVAERLKPLLDDSVAREAVGYLREDFAALDSIGPSRVAAFLGRSDDDAFKADVAGLVERLMRGLE
jgi:hypothetical protein